MITTMITESSKKVYISPVAEFIVTDMDDVVADTLVSQSSITQGSQGVNEGQMNKGTSFDTWDDEDEEDEGDLEILSRSDKVLKLFEDSPYN